MNAPSRTSLIQKVAVLLAVTGISSSISLPVLAQLNPRPSIFNEPPYNRFHSPRPGHGPGHGPRHGPGPGAAYGPPAGAGPAYGRPPAPPAYGRPPVPPAGAPPPPPAGASPR